KGIRRLSGELFGCFSVPVEKKEGGYCPTLRAERQRGISDNCVSQMLAGQQTGSDESERRVTRNNLPVLRHACEIRNQSRDRAADETQPRLSEEQFHSPDDLALGSVSPVLKFRTHEIMGTMGKKRTKKQSAKATLAEVIKEMAKPRVASSAREHRHILRNEILVVENDVDRMAPK